MLRNNYFYRDCYVTNDSINYKRSEFMKVLNRSYRKGCLQCSMVDRELNEFLQFKRRNMIITKKNAVELIGKQKNGCWILENGIYISPTGMEILSSEYVWICHIFEGHGVPKPESACMQYHTTPFNTVFKTLHCNFIWNAKTQLYTGLVDIGFNSLDVTLSIAYWKTSLLPNPLSLWA